MYGPNIANVKVAQDRTRDDIRRAGRERDVADARGTGRSRRFGWTSLAAALRTEREPVFARWTRERRRQVTTTGC